jgi:hypothetical protein
MKLKFEEWLESQKFSDSVHGLFKESIICYKSGAYKASVLFSYLGFLTILKERILNANKPALFPQGEWDYLIIRLQNEDSWESNVYDATQQKEKIDNSKTKTKDAIFSINESLRLQITYWKDRRNDCAHNKNNKISNSHVETFWSFLESNLSKITIEGGINSLLNKLRKHYDSTITPANKDVTPLIIEIESSINYIDLKVFWEQAFEIVDESIVYSNV